MAEALRALSDGTAARGGPAPAGGPRGVAHAWRNALRPEALLPDHGDPHALRALAHLLAETAVDPADPAAAAHLHCPPLAIAVAADLVASALNPSLDSWDQAPGATELEPAVLRTLAQLIGFAEPEAARGVFTTGGTESNLMGLLLARDAVIREHFGADPADGIPPHAAGRLRVYTSAAAHFSFARAAAQLGLGSRAVVPIEVGPDDRMDPTALARALVADRAAGAVPVCIAATAGTTDRGAVDPLRQLAEVARTRGVRLHIDAAYGGGALFSQHLAPLLDGIALADTVGLDLHKLGWQPVAAGVFLAREAATLAPLEQRAAYLNPADDEDAGYTSLLGRSLRTTRRPDVFKLAVTLRALGRSGLGELVDRCHDLARCAAARIAEHPRLELTGEPVLTSLLFRYLPRRADPAAADEINAELRRRLLAKGRAVVGRTETGTGPGAVRLKLTLLNPWATEADLDALIRLVAAAGEAVENDTAHHSGSEHRDSEHSDSERKGATR